MDRKRVKELTRLLIATVGYRCYIARGKTVTFTIQDVKRLSNMFGIYYNPRSLGALIRNCMMLCPHVKIVKRSRYILYMFNREDACEVIEEVSLLPYIMRSNFMKRLNEVVRGLRKLVKTSRHFPIGQRKRLLLLLVKAVQSELQAILHL